jgi:hypothetical protein
MPKFKKVKLETGAEDLMEEIENIETKSNYLMYFAWIISLVGIVSIGALIYTCYTLYLTNITQNTTLTSLQTQITTNLNRNTTTVDGYNTKVGSGVLTTTGLTVIDSFVKTTSLIYYGVRPTISQTGFLSVSSQYNGNFTIVSSAGASDENVTIAYLIMSLP